MTEPHLAPTAERFNRAAVPPEIAELLAEWPDIHAGTAKLVRAADSGGAAAVHAAGLTDSYQKFGRDYQSATPGRVQNGRSGFRPPPFSLLSQDI